MRWARTALLAAAALAACGEGFRGPVVTVERLEPASGPELQPVSVQIIGRGFRLPVERDLDHGGTVVGEVTATFADEPLEAVVWRSEELVDAVVPDTLAPGLYPVTVAFSDGRSAILEDAYEVLPCIFYLDADGDGFGDPSVALTGCPVPTGYVDNADDCDDAGACGPGCFPGNAAADVCDGLDQDCDDAVDEDPDVVWYLDADGDGFGSAATPMASCQPPAGYVADGTDCADTAGSDPRCNGLDGARCSPGLVEGVAPAPTCSDGADNDCDGRTDALDATWCACAGTCGACAGGGCCTQTCGFSGCAMSCPGPCACLQDCLGVGGTCNPLCRGAGRTCYQDCSAVGDCNAQCDTGASCQIDCTASSNCRRIDCESDADCVIDCTNAALCDLECRTGATCLLLCTGATDCRMRTCQGAVQSCPGNVIACNRPCP